MGRVLKRNEHPLDRVARVGVGIGLIWATWSGALGTWGYIGVIPLLTGLTGSCPLYSALGISTCAAKNRTAH